MNTQAGTQHNFVIVGASGALGRALVDACTQRPGVGRVFALSRTAPASLREHSANCQQPSLRDPSSTWERDRGPGPPQSRQEKPPSRAVSQWERSPDRDCPPTEPRWITADATDPDSMAAAAAAVGAEAPRIHRLIICTGVLHGGAADPGFKPEKSLAQLGLAQLQQSMMINAWAPLVALQAFAPLLRHPDGAVAAALSAMVGSIGDNRLGGWYSYRMSKAALNMGIRNAAIELGRHRHGPIVVAVHPGTTQSALSAPFAGPERARPAHESAGAILDVLDGLDRTANGRLFNWDGRELPW